MTTRSVPDCAIPRLMRAEVVANDVVCDEHKRLVLELPRLEGAIPGQFLHLGPLTWDGLPGGRPFLRRAFSIGGLHRQGGRDEVDVLYRVVGAATQWMAGLTRGEAVSALGPLGRGFTLDGSRSIAWVVAGGVGLPPLLWWAEQLSAAGKPVVAFCGARTRALMPLAITDASAVPADATAPSLAAREFAVFNIPAVLATDDGTLGFRGTVVEALAAYHQAQREQAEEITVYCCGPERMMRAVARYSLDHALACQVCLEREMACGTGTCQSCAVAIDDPSAPDGWRYGLCCSEGPVFDARVVRWAY